MDGRFYFTINLDRGDGHFTDYEVSHDRTPQEWTGSDISGVIDDMSVYAGHPAIRGTGYLAEFQFIGADGAGVRFRVRGPSGTATTKPPLSITAERLAAAGLVQSPPDSIQ